MTGFPLQLPLLSGTPRVFSVAPLTNLPGSQVLMIELASAQEVTAITDWLAGLRNAPNDPIRKVVL